MKKVLRILIFFTKIKTQIFKISIIHKPSLGSLDVPQKFGPDRFSSFDVYWIQTDRQTTFIGYKQTDRQTDKQTNRQAKFIYRFLLIIKISNSFSRPFPEPFYNLTLNLSPYPLS